MHNLSLIIPVFNEAQNLPILFDSIQQTLETFDCLWEVIFVDDGSRDNSFEVLKSLAEKDEEHVRVVVFRGSCALRRVVVACGFVHGIGGKE